MNPKELERFESKIRAKSIGCWLWTGYLIEFGYGKLRVGSVKNGDRREELAHRLSYKHFVGPIPEGMHVCHRCDNPSCVRPDHLFLGTDADNSADKCAKNRQRNGDQRGEVNGFAKLTEDQARSILWDYAGLNNKEVAELFGVNHSTVSALRLGKSWKHLARPVHKKYSSLTNGQSTGQARRAPLEAVAHP